MSRTVSGPWLFFLFNLPGTRASERVKFWRRLKKFGAIQLKTSAYVLPDEPVHYGRFQWLGKEIVDVGGEATLARVAELEGMPYAALVLFNDARSKDYDEVSETLTLLIKDQKARKANPEAFANQLQKLKGRFQEIQAIDYFQCSRGEDVQRLIQKADALESPAKKLAAGKRLQSTDYLAKIWLTRTRPEIDRVGSAWLIRRFIIRKQNSFLGTRPPILRPSPTTCSMSSSVITATIARSRHWSSDSGFGTARYKGWPS